MGKYILRRLLVMIPTLLFVVFIIFAILQFIPNSPGRIILGINAPQEQVELLNQQLGYYDPMPVKFVNYVLNALKGDFGESYKYSKPVFEVLMPKFPTTAKLAFLSMLVSAVIGIPVGIIAAVKKHSMADRSATVLALLLGSVPSFFLGVLMILLFSMKLHWLPSNGLGTWKNYIMPAITLGTGDAALICRMTRSSMLEVIRQDYIRTARAKGVPGWKVIFKHALRNALIPVITYVGPMVAYILTGSMVVENIFTIGGLGSSFVTSITNRDYTMIMATTIFLAILMVVANLLTDIAYKFVDPRITFE